MATQAEVPSISFSGTGQVQETAARVFEILRAHGMFMADNAPIRVKQEDLIAFVTGKGTLTAADVEAAIAENPSVFAVETDADGAAVVATTRRGQAPAPEADGSLHTFAQRLMTPEPKPATPVVPVRERVRVDPSWATFTMPDFADELEEDEEVTGDGVDVVAALEPELEIEAAPAAPPAPTEEPAVVEAARAIAELDVAAETQAAAPEPVAVAPSELVMAPPAATVSPAQGTDVSGFGDAAIAQAIGERLGTDIHVARFGDQWMPEDRVPRLSRGDLRRIKDYIEEQEQPLTDATLVQDILGVRPNQPDFTLMQFAVNVRLGREHREFHFVGTNDQRFWSTSNLPQIGTTRRKPNEIGTDYRFLLDEAGEAALPRSNTSVDHVVTFYEYTLGLLPLDTDMQRLLPAPVDPEQRTAVLTFEIPQSYTTYLVEVRYPTPNRGGFLLGLDDFYAESLVPGAIISISATENDGHYKVEFLGTDSQSDRLLELDDRRSPRYLFRPTTYACAVADEWLINEDRFPNLGSEKPLADKVRRRTDEVLKITFERIGMPDGEGGYLASFEDLLAAINIERPFSAALLRATLEQDPSVSGDDANGYTYASAA